MTDFKGIETTDHYADIIDDINARVDELAKQLAGDNKNLPDGAVKWNSGQSRWEIQDGGLFKKLCDEYGIDINGTAGNAKQLGGKDPDDYRKASKLTGKAPRSTLPHATESSYGAVKQGKNSGLEAEEAASADFAANAGRLNGKKDDDFVQVTDLEYRGIAGANDASDLNNKSIQGLTLKRVDENADHTPTNNDYVVFQGQYDEDSGVQLAIRYDDSNEISDLQWRGFNANGYMSWQKAVAESEIGSAAKKDADYFAKKDGTHLTNGLTVNPDSSNEYLRFNGDRPWVFIKGRSGPQEYLNLSPTSSGKSFYITNQELDWKVEFHPDGQTVLRVNGDIEARNLQGRAVYWDGGEWSKSTGLGNFRVPNNYVMTGVYKIKGGAGDWVVDKIYARKLKLS